MKVQKSQENFLIPGLKEKQLKAVPIVYPEIPGRNKNVYSKEELKKGAEYYNRIVKVDPTYKYSFAKHPENEEEEWFGLVAGAVDNLYYLESSDPLAEKGEGLYGDFTLFPNALGAFLCWLNDKDYPIGVSMRGGAKEKTPEVLHWNNQAVNVIRRKGLMIEGVDFVVYPSFITTNASQKHSLEIKEKTSKKENDLQSLFFDFADEISLQEEVNLSSDRIREMFDKNKKKETDKMTTGISLEKAQKVLSEQIASLEKQIEEKNTEISQKDSSLSEISASISVLKKSLEEKEKSLNELENSIKEKEATLSSLKDQESKSEKFLKIGNQVFSEEKKPVLRFLPMNEKISEGDWTQAKADKVSALLAFTGDEEINKSVFCLPSEKKYPVCSFEKSQKEGVDFDIFFNKKAVEEAENKFLGKESFSLSKEQKKEFSENLQKFSNGLEEQGFGEVSNELKTVFNNTKYLEKMEDSGDVFTNNFFEQGILRSENSGEVLEQIDFFQVKKEISKDLFSLALQTISGGKTKNLFSRKEKVKEKTDENGNPIEMDNEDAEVIDLEEVITAMLESNDTEEVDFISEFGISSYDTFFENFILPTSQLFEENPSEGVKNLNKFALALMEYISAETEIQYINNLFALMSSCFLQVEGENSGEVEGEDSRITEKTKNKKEQNMEFDKIKEAILKSNPEAKIETEEDVLLFLSAKEDNSFENKKKEAIAFLVEKGVSEEDSADFFADCKNEEELAKVTARAEKLLGKKEEQNNNTQKPERVKEKAQTKTDLDEFEKFMRNA